MQFILLTIVQFIAIYSAMYCKFNVLFLLTGVLTHEQGTSISEDETPCQVGRDWQAITAILGGMIRFRPQNKPILASEELNITEECANKTLMPVIMGYGTS